MAKVTRDNWWRNMISNILDMILQLVGYGTAKHLEGLEKLGVTQFTPNQFWTSQNLLVSIKKDSKRKWLWNSQKYSVPRKKEFAFASSTILSQVGRGIIVGLVVGLIVRILSFLNRKGLPPATRTLSRSSAPECLMPIIIYLMYSFYLSA